MWFLLLLLHTFAHFGPVNSADAKQGKIILRNENDANPCEGHVEVYYDNEMGYVGDKNWNEKTDEVVCKSTHCGRPVGNSNVYRSYSRPVWLNELDCKGNEESLWDCDGWPGPSVSFYRKPTVKKVKCSLFSKVVLYDSDRETKCYGYVKIQKTQKNDKKSHVCGDDWTEKESEMVCKELNCGKVIKELKTINGKNGIMNHVKCTGSESSLWYCRAEHRSQKCTSAPYVVCQGSREVRLQDGPGKCAGRLEVKDEGQWKRVSKENWDGSYTKHACKQLDCGDDGKDKSDSDEFSQGTGEMLTFRCQQSDKNLADCTATNTNNQNRNEKAVQLICNENKLLFLDGPQSCSGDVAIEYKEELYWLSGSNERWNKELANKVCQQMHCGNATRHNQSSPGVKNRMWNESFSCSSDQKSIFDCNKTQINSSNSTIAHVECEGSIKPRFNDKDNQRHKCSGNVEVSYEGQWLPVCNSHWKEEYSHMVCQQLGRGNAI
uniref:SRCR domain-containing protein n=1 Tax=Poecilia formosa TaxID=48698 RepID=A0A096MHZ1_POEFO